MELKFAPKFWRYFDRLTPRERRQVEVRLVLLADNYLHPGLRASKWRQPNTWYARVTRDIRMFYEVYDDHYLLLAVGHHDIEREM